MTRRASRRDVLTGRILSEDTGGSNAPELHVSSLIVHARPEHVESVRLALQTMPGVEIHGGSDTGKIIITLETATEHVVVQTMGAIGELPGVLSTALVYHHSEPTGPA